jgi:5-oxoprolinase (ATP-hydrolysing)
VHSHMTNTLMTDPEVLELRFPVRVEQFAIRHGSGGAGAHHGGNGLTRDIRFLDDVTVTTLTSHRTHGAHGAAGGDPGTPGRNLILSDDGDVLLPGNSETALTAGQVFRMQTPGGGGFGPKA